MKEKQAKRHLVKMLDSFTPGGVLHLLADVMAEAAEAARSADDVRRFQQFKMVEQTLVVVGMGVDAACPS